MERASRRPFLGANVSKVTRMLIRRRGGNNGRFAASGEGAFRRRRAARTIQIQIALFVLNINEHLSVVCFNLY